MISLSHDRFESEEALALVEQSSNVYCGEVVMTRQFVYSSANKLSEAFLKNLRVFMDSRWNLLNFISSHQEVQPCQSLRKSARDDLCAMVNGLQKLYGLALCGDTRKMMKYADRVCELARKVFESAHWELLLKLAFMLSLLVSCDCGVGSYLTSFFLRMSEALFGLQARHPLTLFLRLFKQMCNDFDTMESFGRIYIDCVRQKYSGDTKALGGARVNVSHLYTALQYSSTTPVRYAASSLSLLEENLDTALAVKDSRSDLYMESTLRKLDILIELDRGEQAVSEAVDVLDIYKTKSLPPDTFSASVIFSLAEALMRVGDFDEAEDEFRHYLSEINVMDAMQQEGATWQSETCAATHIECFRTFNGGDNSIEEKNGRDTEILILHQTMAYNVAPMQITINFVRNLSRESKRICELL